LQVERLQQASKQTPSADGDAAGEQAAVGIAETVARPGALIVAWERPPRLP
jgi:hypothetical protein